jgi:argininosuccinate lyase
LAVRFAVERNCDLSELKIDQLRQFSGLIGDDIYAVLTLEGSLAARNHTGGTSPKQVEAAIARARQLLA